LAWLGLLHAFLSLSSDSTLFRLLYYYYFSLAVVMGAISDIGSKYQYLLDEYHH
jgi:hypothetical protein